MNGNEIADPYFDLDVIGVMEGSDKSSAFSHSWDYLRHYQAYFERWREAPINLIEIGVKGGVSLNLWRQFFKRATIIGIDIDPVCRRYAGDRVIIEIGSQADPVLLSRVCAEHPPTIIIDDGSHLANHIVFTFTHMFPLLAPGGLYVIEDMALHFGPIADRWAGDKSVSAVEFFWQLTQARLANRPPGMQFTSAERYIFQHLDSISFINSAIVISKKKARESAAAIDFAEGLLQERGAPAKYLRQSGYILRHQGPLNEAEVLTRKGIEMGGINLEASLMLADILTRQGRLDEACETATNATKTWPQHGVTWERLCNIEKQRGRLNAAIAALNQAAALNPKVLGYQDQLSRLHQKQGDLKQALAAAKKAAELGPGNEGLRQRVAELSQLTRV
jgi:tetratricopeptide (TPR) repeat protein